jgi:hypothetical protein
MTNLTDFRRFRNTTLLVSATGVVFNEASARHVPPFKNQFGYIQINYWDRKAKTYRKFSVNKMVKETFGHGIDIPWTYKKKEMSYDKPEYNPNFHN